MGKLRQNRHGQNSLEPKKNVHKKGSDWVGLWEQLVSLKTLVVLSHNLQSIVRPESPSYWRYFVTSTPSTWSPPGFWLKKS